MNATDEKNHNPLFTIIIPVKNRGNYIKNTLLTCTSQSYRNIEIIVSDDGSSDNTREIVEEAIRLDDRIKYYFHENGIGMRENFEFALNKVKPGYIIALGGDDGILPNGIQGMLNVLNATGMELLAWPAALFSFPGVYGPNGQLVIHHKKGIKIIESKDFLSRQAKNLYYLSDIESPMFYVKGVVSTRLVDKVRSRSKDGKFYSCPTPDGYSGIVLAGEVTHYAFSGEPFSIYGMSSSSQGLAYQSNDKEAKTKSEAFFKDMSSRKMHAELAEQPYSPLITLMTVDYLLTAKDLPGWNGTFQEIDFKKVLSNGIDELALGLYGESRICRELLILKKIAEKHNLERYFSNKIEKTKRNRQTQLFDGNGLSPRVFYLDAKQFDVTNIFDAAYAAKNIYKLYNELSFFKIIYMIINSFKYRIKSRQKDGAFPDESDWERLSN
jgi:glycosyltransferase involved in cell wall biosynthesis